MTSLSIRQLTLAVAALFLVLAGIWLSGIGERKLANPDEGRYSVLSMQMADSGDFVTPRLNGLKYFEKPPMQYWATALSFKVFGKSDWSARLYTALSGLLSVLLVGVTAARLFTREVGLFAGLSLVGCFFFVAMAQVVTLDMGLTFWMTLTACAFMLSQTEARGQLWWLCLAAIGAAGAVLSKGLIGIVFPGAVLFLYCLIQWDWRRLLAINWWIAVPLFFLVVTPWFVLVADQNPEFLRFFFIHEHFERFTTTQHRRVAPWWFFLPIIFAGVTAWAFLLLPAVKQGWQHRTGAASFQPLRFAIIWVVFITFFFSLSGSKLAHYVLPVFPLLAILIGAHLANTSGRRIAAFLLPIPLIVAALAYALTLLPEKLARNPQEMALYRDYAVMLVAVLWILAVGTAVAVASFWRNSKVSRRWGAFAVAAASVVCFHTLNNSYDAKLSAAQSGHALGQAIKQQLTPATRLYAVSTYDQSLPFYLGRSLTLVDYVDEFEMGEKSEPSKHIAKLADFPAVWNQPGAVVAIIAPQDKEKMHDLGLHFDVIIDTPRRTAILKREAP